MILKWTRRLAFVSCLIFWSSFASAINYNVTLTPAQEVPAPNVTGFTPSATATVSINTITGATSISGSYAGMTSPTTGFHIHGLAGPGSNAGVLIGLSHSSATSGSLSGGGTLSSANVTGLLAGNTYLNLHTSMNAGGEIRAQVADSDILVLNVPLETSQEVGGPIVINSGSNPMGMARVVVDRSSGDIEITGSYSGMNTPLTGLHLHGLAPAGVNTGVIFPLTDATPGQTSGTFSGMSTLSATNLAGLLNNQTYINLHTSVNSGGEIRGQVIVPEPSALAILVSAMLLGVVGVRRRCTTRRP